VVGVLTGHVFIALLRGVNVGGTNRLPMKELIAVLEGIGCRNVETHIRSGNAVFESDEVDRMELAKELSSEIQSRFGFASQVLLLVPADLERAIAQNPFPEAESNPSRLHLGFLASPPVAPDLAKMEGLRSGGERFLLLGTVLYLYAPDGVGRSRLAASAEKLLGAPVTNRNWTTVCKLRDIAQEKRD
jgi:uncharacterized protein (DUF1697 family)